MARKPRPIAFAPTDLRLLRVFQAVVRHEGFATAQDELGLSPGTISNHIAHLEARFGVRLCVRGRRGFSLTPDGLRIHDAAENLLRSIENFAGIVGSVRGELTGTVHLGTVDAMHTNKAAPLDRAIASFSEQAPKVMLHVEIASPQDLLQRLLDGRYTVIVTPTEDAHPSVTAIPLYREEQRLYCGRGHPLFEAGEGVTAEAVRRHPYAGRSYMQGRDQERSTGFENRAMTSHMEAIAILIRSGRYIGYLPAHFAQPFVRRREMRSLLDRELAYLDTFHLAWRKDEQNRAAALLFRCLENALREDSSRRP